MGIRMMRYILNQHEVDNDMVELYSENGKYLIAIIHEDFLDRDILDALEDGEITIEIERISL